MYHQDEVLTLGKEAVSSNALQESPAGRRAYSPTPVVFGAAADFTPQCDPDRAISLGQ